MIQKEDILPDVLFCCPEPKSPGFHLGSRGFILSKSLTEFAPAGANQTEFIFSGDMPVGENAYSFSSSACHTAAWASEGIRQSPRGDTATLPTLGPSGRQLRLNCWLKNRR